MDAEALSAGKSPISTSLDEWGGLLRCRYRGARGGVVTHYHPFGEGGGGSGQGGEGTRVRAEICVALELATSTRLPIIVVILLDPSVRKTFMVRVLAFTDIPLHAVRRAMAAAPPLLAQRRCLSYTWP